MAAQHPQMITANRLRDGEVVWWKAGAWVGALGDGEVFSEPQAADRALEEALGFVRENVVVNPYLFDVRLEGGRVRPVKEREIIRAGGPSIHTNLGKQAKSANV